MTVVGPGILLLINEIFQLLFNEPKKREEQLEMACHVACGKIMSSDNGTKPRSLGFIISTGTKIRFIEQPNGVHVQHDSAESKPVFDKSGNSFKTLDELQMFRRNDISENKIKYEKLFSQSDSKELFRTASLISVLSTTNIDANQTSLDACTKNEIKTVYGLTDDKFENAYKSIQEALVKKPNTAHVYTGLDLLSFATKPLFVMEKDWRYDEESGRSFETPRSIYNLTNAGEEKIAAYYNKKYFQSGKNERKLIVTKNDADFKNKLSGAISDESCRMAGFLFSSNPSPDAHPTPIVLEKKDGEFHFFISDSMIFIPSQYRAITETLKDYPEAKAKIRISSVSASRVSRQADNGSCHSDALYYLQRALRLGSMCEQVTITTESIPNAEYDIFTEPADLLLTAQTSRALSKNNVELISKLKLGKPDKPKTFGDKTSKYNGDVEYSEMDNSETKKKFKTRGFLSHVNQKHHSILMTENYV